MEYILFTVQTNLRTFPPVLKPAIIYGMDLVNGKMRSGCHILKVVYDLRKTKNTRTLFLLSYSSGSLREREIVWEHKPIYGLPQLLRIFPNFPGNDIASP